MAKRKVLIRTTFHQYVIGELAAAIAIEPSKDARRRASDAAKLIRRVDTPAGHRPAVLEMLNVVERHFGGVFKNKAFSTAQRAEFYGAHDSLKQQDKIDARNVAEELALGT
jgi:hypothetical protein